MAPSVLIAPDKFKGTYTAAEVAGAIATGVAAAGGVGSCLPIADGGDGTAEILRLALGGHRMHVPSSDALGRPIDASFVMLPDGRAVVDVAEASGLGRLAQDERNALQATSAGTGTLIVAAVAAGAREILLAAGGSACTDGAEGAIAVIRAAGLRPRVTVVCDVQVPFELAAPIFGPQKGASPRDVAELERRLERLARAAPRDPRRVPMTGAAGGMAGGMWAWLGARLVAGAPFVLHSLGFDERLRGANLVITGEGRIDDQTQHGKAVAEVARRSVRAGITCAAIVGRNELGDAAGRGLGLASITEAGDPSALAEAAHRLTAAAR